MRCSGLFEPSYCTDTTIGRELEHVLNIAALADRYSKDHCSVHIANIGRELVPRIQTTIGNVLVKTIRFVLGLVTVLVAFLLAR